ncbi:hypothetical protein IT072_02310 [Leifsonia sp. ZF2019]|uniref:hypothetical protein n=1 Tax=Leifsonia sp. ZF2019 TaxID=2781978 RepID=UPI001CBBA58A|nr:hypothetical protein [Leifsonia sp. ZF2019]UAJ78300.1 hypothetical protein IT072_13635 [Leifsonia sp. ZF2019]UAJ79930.1 hypothetical protein IT072_02310 [Leifsonia sp. ZF2019]
MSDTNTNLGNVISSNLARKIIYGAYAVAGVVVGGAGAYFLATGHTVPEVIIGAQGVITYLAIPVGGLALANTSSAPKGDHVADGPADV